MYTTVPLQRALEEVGLGLFLVTAAYQGEDNVQRSFRVVPLSEKPEPRIGVAMLTDYKISELIRGSGQLIVNVSGPVHIPKPRPPRHDRPLVADEFAAIDAVRMPAALLEAPRVRDCAAYLECAVEQEVIVQDRSLFVCRVLQCDVDEEISPAVRIRGKGLDVTPLLSAAPDARQSH